MGEEADWIIENMLGEGVRGRTGFNYGKPNFRKTCRYCGESELAWIGGKLHNRKYERHRCEISFDPVDKE